MRRTHLGATSPGAQLESLRSQLRPNATRQAGTRNRNLGQAAHLRASSTLSAPHRAQAPLLPSCSNPAATSSRNRLLTPFLTPVSALFNLNIYSAVQSSSSKPVTVLNLLKTPSAPTAHEFRLTSNSTENPKAAAGQLQAQPTCVLPEAKNGFRMCKV